MKIAVCVKAVPDAAAGRRLDPATNRLDRSGELAISDFDTYAVEEALKLKEAAGDGEVVVISMGPEKAHGRAAQGACDGRRPGSARDGSRSRGSRPARHVRVRSPARSRREGADLVLFGQQSADGGGACLWSAVAERLRRPVISQVSELDARGRLRHRQAARPSSGTTRFARRCRR